ncbi:MAG: hypothetical protein ACFCVG_08915 [Kineosporiaceae bacterium]
MPAGTLRSAPTAPASSRTASWAALLQRALAAVRPLAGRPWAEPALVLAAVAAVQLWAVSDSTTPVQTKDEVGYLLAGRFLAGAGGAELLAPDFAGGYAAGWGMLTFPLWWLGLAPDRVYQASILLNVVIVLATVPVLAALARRVGAGPRAALLVAAVVSVAPGRALYTGYTQPEVLVGFLLAVVAVLGWDVLAGRASVRTVALLAAAAGYLPVVHARTTPVAALVALLLLWVAWRERRPAPAWAAGAITGLTGAGWLLNRWVEAALYPQVDGRVAAAGEQVTQLYVDLVALVAAGQAWYGAAAWLGLSVLGGVLLTARLLAGGRAAPLSPERLWSGWLLACCASQWLVGAAYLSTRFGEGARLDMIVYGRYADPAWGLLAVVGAAALIAGRLSRRLLGAAVAATVVLCLAAWLAVTLLAPAGAGALWLNVPGLQAWEWRTLDGFAVPLLPASVALLVAVGAVVLGARGGVRARTVLVAVLGVALVAGTVAAEVRNFRPRDDGIRELFSLRSDVVERSPESVLLVVDRPFLLTGNAFQFWLGDQPIRLADPDDGPVRPLPGELVIDQVGPVPGPMSLAPAASVTGLLALVARDSESRYGLWQVAPSPAQPAR